MFGDAFWMLVALVFEQYGIFAIIQMAQIALLVYAFRLSNKKENDKTTLTDKLLELSEKRLEDAKEEREDYEELAKRLDKSINLLIQVFRRRGGEGEG